MSARLFSMIGAICVAGACTLNDGPPGAPVSEMARPSVETAEVFTARSGQSAQAFRGSIEVPENRNNPNSRTISLEYVRFPATGGRSGSPIVYLAGGPGGSGIATARGNRFPLFMAMREFGDVIALDQRGTGASNDMPRCVSGIVIPSEVLTPDEEIVRLNRRAAEECGTFWEEQGIDVHGYTTPESVQDLDALRRHLGAEKISLWGISYGSHLSLAALKVIDDRLDRVVIASAEGLAQTAKMPASTDAYFQRLQDAINTQPDAAAVFPDIAGLIRRVHARLDEEPVLLKIERDDLPPADVMLTRRTMQQLASGMIADPPNAITLLNIYRATDAGDYSVMAGVIRDFFPINQPISFAPMSLAMDVASGISDERLALLREQAETSLLGDELNFEIPHLRGVLGLDLGDEFREPPTSDVPVLLLTGTLDGRTYIEEQRESVAGLSSRNEVMVINAGHNLFMSSPEVTSVIQSFMRGEDVDGREIVVDLPRIAP